MPKYVPPAKRKTAVPTAPPKAKTPEFQAALDERERARAAGREYAERKAKLLDEVASKFSLGQAEERSSYGADSDHSWFRDRFVVTMQERTRDEMIASGLPFVDQASSGVGADVVHGGDADARRRLASVEKRSVTGALAFVPVDATPTFIADAFATGARAKSVLPSLLQVFDLPRQGSRIETARFATSPTVAVQATEGSSASSTDPDWDLVVGPKATIAGMVDLSVQAFEFIAGGQMDVVLGRELGEALGATVDQQILYGTGTNGQLKGLVNSIGTAVTRSDASSAANSFAAVNDLVQQTGVAYGALPSVVLLHPRRYAFIVGKLGYAPQWLARPVAVNSITSNNGSSTNEDHVFAIEPSEIFFYVERPRIEIFLEVLSGGLQARVRALQYAALLGGRKPAAIGRSTGSQYTPPVF